MGPCVVWVLYGYGTKCCIGVGGWDHYHVGVGTEPCITCELGPCIMCVWEWDHVSFEYSMV